MPNQTSWGPPEGTQPQASAENQPVAEGPLCNRRNAWRWVFGHSLIIQLHIYIGTLLIVVALVALILSIRARHPIGIAAAVAGLALLIFAWLSGDQFLVTQHNDLSLRMALGFIGAFVAYLLGYFFAGVHSQKPSI
jgi:hypothetical protein